MKVQITREEDKKPYVHIVANEIAYEVASIDRWIRDLRLAKAWLTRKASK